MKEGRLVSISRCHRHRRRGRRSRCLCHSKSYIPDPAISGKKPWETAVLNSSGRSQTGSHRQGLRVKGAMLERTLVRTQPVELVASENPCLRCRKEASSPHRVFGLIMWYNLALSNRLLDRKNEACEVSHHNCQSISMLHVKDFFNK